ncbi:MAG TPA: prepilin-type N-terminal cleavage/methylation domain-containing protein [Terriglobia bacterium]|nr:prepilin-type N-terminal cleavage/methylation domain-containing protein [Terriglobia bacterium]
MQLLLVDCLPKHRDSSPAQQQAQDGGFSLLEMMVSVLIILLLMSAIFPFIMQSQKRFQGNEVTAESNQSGRAALEVMSQEIGQAGYNPAFTANKTSTAALTSNGCTQFLPVSDLTGINPGDWLSVDTGPSQELVQVFSTSNAIDGTTYYPLPPTPSPSTACEPTSCTCLAPPPAPWIQAKFQNNHPLSTPIVSYKMPYGGGLLIHFTAGVNDNTQSNATTLEFYGDINQNNTIMYVEYSLYAKPPVQTVTINGTVYTLYTLYRSIAQVPFPSLFQPTGFVYTAPNNVPASPMVAKVLFNTTTGTGPTGQPIFAYPNTVTVGVVPNQITVVGTIVITICVAVNPESLETGVVQWYTMATQIRPLNLSAAVNVVNNSGSLYLPVNPKSLPMPNPTTGYYP